MTSPIKQIAVIGLSLVTAVLGAVAVFYIRNSQPIFLPQPRGPKAVGRMLFDWTDSRRSRELMVFVWYPAASGTSGRRAEYLPGRWGEIGAINWFPVPKARIREINVAAVEGRPVLDGAHPLLVFAPAMGRLPTDYTTIAEDLASYGYVVAGVTPTGSARVVVFGDGRTVYATDDVDLERRAEAQPLVSRWVGDFSFVLDRLGSEAVFQDRLDWSRAGVFGHSFGGAAAMQALQKESRFHRGVNLDGAVEGELPLGISKPLVIVNGAPLPPSQQALNDRILAELKSVCNSDTAGCRFEDFPRAGHMNFSDAGALPSRFPIPRSHSNLTAIDGPAFLRKIADVLRSFFDQM